jgi:2-polyprenyl-6-hydroxyphenyl methylase/3-demethylubiquinone-9 3-methyltransferase
MANSFMTEKDLTKPETHFAFGRNWASYAQNVTEAEIREAEAGLLRLLGGERPKAMNFLDIGSGSGLHSLAALRLGACRIHAVDIDKDSVDTTQAMLSSLAPGQSWKAERASVFDLTPEQIGEFDVVYSWGVLHHTGNLDRALSCASRLVRPGGQFVFALYRRVIVDFLWRSEKRWYARASPAAQDRARAMYTALFRAGLRLTGRKFRDYVRGYRSNRGMDFDHDVHDWMGGWPYESISPEEVEAFMGTLAFEKVRSFVSIGRFFGRHTGVFGSGCDEFVYRRLR